MIYLCGTKIDLSLRQGVTEEAMAYNQTKGRQVSTEEAMAYAQSKGMGYIETSAKDNFNISQLFERLTASLVETLAPLERYLDFNML